MTQRTRRRPFVRLAQATYPVCLLRESVEGTMKVVTFARFVARGIALSWRAGKGLFLASTLSSVVGAVVVPLQILLLAATIDLVPEPGRLGVGR